MGWIQKMVDEISSTTVQEKPDITRARSLEEYEGLIEKYAKYWRVVEIRPGAWRRGEQNIIGTQHATYEEAMIEAKRRYEIEPNPKRGSLLYAIADFPGASNMAALVGEYPETSGKYSSRYRKQTKKPRESKKYDIPPPGTIEPSERYFEGDAYSGGVTTVVTKGKSQRAIKYKNKRG